MVMLVISLVATYGIGATIATATQRVRVAKRWREKQRHNGYQPDGDDTFISIAIGILWPLSWPFILGIAISDHILDKHERQLEEEERNQKLLREHGF